jgi:metallo-beta-lactamase family protein
LWPRATQWYDINAAVYVLNGFSGHADHNDLAWLYGQAGGKFVHAFLVHGQPKSMEALAPFVEPFVQTPSASPRSNPDYTARGLN